MEGILLPRQKVAGPDALPLMRGWHSRRAIERAMSRAARDLGA
ncbi:hypothetical protein [Burkholderia plantarii]|nr:hypothetical protein [Burkholderia plantarii]